MEPAGPPRFSAQKHCGDSLEGSSCAEGQEMIFSPTYCSEETCSKIFLLYYH